LLAFGLPGGKSDVLVYVWRYVRVANNNSILIAVVLNVRQSIVSFMASIIADETGISREQVSPASFPRWSMSKGRISSKYVYCIISFV